MAKPGVYELNRESITITELMELAGGRTGDAVAKYVRPLTREQIAQQMATPQSTSPPLPLLQTSDYFYSGDDLVHPGDIVVFDQVANPIQQTVHHGNANGMSGEKVELILANLIGRPIHTQVDAAQASVASLAQLLGISPAKVEQNAIIVMRSKNSPGGDVSGQMLATDPLPSGTILVFDPRLIQLDQLSSESIEQLTRSQKPIRVAARPDNETRTDVPQSDLMHEYAEPAESVLQVEPGLALNAPQFIDEPTPAPEEELMLEGTALAQSSPDVQMLEAPAAGSGMYDGESNIIDVEAMLANNSGDLPVLDETPLPPMDAEMNDVALGLAAAPGPSMARNQASLWVISVLVVMIASVLGYYLFNNRQTQTKAKPKSKPKAAAARQPVRRPNMLENLDDPKVAMYRQKIEQKKKMFAASMRREADLQIDALINDVLPLKEEELVITRTFNLPGIGQSFRIDPANTELQGPHFRQAARVNRKSNEKVSATVGADSSRPAGTNGPQSTRPAATRPASQASYTIHKGGSQHFGSGK
ncbi:MAG: hypothetical protein R3C11_09825 [Planctomycetaceae bacterium]